MAADYDINGTWGERTVDGVRRWVFVSTIKPDGGDFATLQGWHDAVSAIRAAQTIVDNDSVERAVAGGELWAECYGGGNLGTLVIGTSAFADADGDAFPRIYAADGHWQDGFYDDRPIPQGAWIHNDDLGSFDYPVRIAADFVRMEGVRITGADQAHAGIYVVSYYAQHGVLIDGCCFQVSSTSPTRHTHCCYVALSHSSQNATADAVVRNCIAYGLGQDSITMGFVGKVECATDNQQLSLTLDIYNNTAVNVNDNIMNSRAAFYMVATDGGHAACTADMLRYEVVAAFGGVYMDIDIECLRPIDELLVGCGCFAACEYDPATYGLTGPTGITNATFGATPGHPAIRRIIQTVPEVFCATDPLSAGPKLFRTLMHARPDVRIFEKHIFSPLLPHEARRLTAVRPAALSGAYAVHWFNLSWLPPAESRANLS